MAEKRWKTRHRKRIPVRFGVDELTKVGFTEDLNHGGLFIKSAVVARPGVTLRVELKVPEGPVELVAVVRWAKKVPPSVIHKLKGGMGVQIKEFVHGEDIYGGLCAELVKARGE